MERTTETILKLFFLFCLFFCSKMLMQTKTGRNWGTTKGTIAAWPPPMKREQISQPTHTHTHSKTPQRTKNSSPKKESASGVRIERTTKRRAEIIKKNKQVRTERTREGRTETISKEKKGTHAQKKTLWNEMEFRPTQTHNERKKNVNSLPYEHTK